METSLSIIEYKEIIQAINDNYGVDLSQHAIGALNNNFIHLMQTSKYSTPSSFIKGIKSDRLFFENILSCIYCEHISLFREPGLWRIIKETVFDKILKKTDLKIWLPEVSNGSDYYSTLIFLQKYNLLKKAKIIVSDRSKINLDKCRIGKIDQSILANSESNMKRIDNSLNLTDYIEKRDFNTYLKKELIKNTSFYNSGIEDTIMPFKANLVIFKNRMIYYNHVKEQKTINIIHKSMASSGFLIIGVKENIEQFNIDKKFKIDNKEEQIYKRYF